MAFRLCAIQIRYLPGSKEQPSSQLRAAQARSAASIIVQSVPWSNLFPGPARDRRRRRCFVAKTTKSRGRVGLTHDQLRRRVNRHRWSQRRTSAQYRRRLLPAGTAGAVRRGRSAVRAKAVLLIPSAAPSIQPAPSRSARRRRALPRRGARAQHRPGGTCLTRAPLPPDSRGVREHLTTAGRGPVGPPVQGTGARGGVLKRAA